MKDLISVNSYSHLVTYASPDMERSMRLCRDSALAHGVDQAWPWYQQTLHTLDFYEKNKSILDNPKGAGLWAWKPFVILYEMAKVPTGCYLIYADAGVEFINNVSHIIDRMDQDIFLFGNMWEHAHWCKRDIVEAVMPMQNIGRTEGRSGFGDTWLGTPWSRFGKQVQASVIFFRVNDYTRAFVKEWLDWCLFEGGRLIDDSPSRLPNHPEFQENRHDQAILTTMAYRDGIKLHYWPAVYGDGRFPYERGDYPDEGYPVMFFHHRKRNHEWSVAA